LEVIYYTNITILIIKLLGGKKSVIISNEKTEIGEKNKEKELVRVTEKLIQEFEGQMSNDIDLLVDSDRLMSKFTVVEENIIKIMEKKHLIQFEKEKIEIENKSEIQVKQI